MEDGIEIGGYPVPKGSMLAASVYAVHRDPRWWPEPERYDPIRFVDSAAVKQRPRLAFMAFGSGPHHCIGTSLAYMNAQFLLAIIFQRFRLSLPPEWVPHRHLALSTTVEGGLPVTISRV